MKRRFVVSVVTAALLIGVLVAGALGGGRDRGSTAGPGIEARPGPAAVATSFDGDLRDLPQTDAQAGRRFHEPHEPFGAKQGGETAPLGPTPQPSAQMPSPSVSFAGIGFSAGGGGWPPDTAGDVGPSHFVQAVNASFAVYGKTGTLLAGPTSFNALWPNTTGTPCDADNLGDPTVVYDPIGDRWILGDFAFTLNAQNADQPPYYECIAVSKTSDPVAGGWWLYPVRLDDAGCSCLGDYPKMGIWPDGLYLTASMFAAGGGSF